MRKRTERRSSEGQHREDGNGKHSQPTLAAVVLAGFEAMHCVLCGPVDRKADVTARWMCSSSMRRTAGKKAMKVKVRAIRQRVKDASRSMAVGEDPWQREEQMEQS